MRWDDSEAEREPEAHARLAALRASHPTVRRLPDLTHGRAQRRVGPAYGARIRTESSEILPLRGCLSTMACAVSSSRSSAHSSSSCRVAARAPLGAVPP